MTFRGAHTLQPDAMLDVASIRDFGRMKPCYDAALALAGWYLMVPPSSPGHLGDTTAPLSKWEVASVHDSASECAEQERKLRSLAAEMGKNNPPIVYRQYKAAQCIASDDPRLKGN